MNNIRRLQLEGAYNVRELGGYPINGNAITKWGVFLRSDDLAAVTKNDLDLLYDYGIRTIINLKAVEETDNPIEDDKRFNHMHIPLVDDFSKMFELIKSYDSFYMTMIQCFRENIVRIFNCIAEHIGKGEILFHCVSGKDRTGIIAMLILMMSGVSDLDVLADYIVSAVYMRPDAIKRNKPFDAIIKYPEEIEQIIEVMKSEYDGARGYLKNIGVLAENINIIKDNFIVAPKR